MFNLKTILRTQPKARREYRSQYIEYQRNKRLQEQQIADIEKNTLYVNSQQLKQYNDLKKSYESAFRRQGQILANAYSSETQKALTKQKTNLDKYYKQQAELEKLKQESEKITALNKKINFLGIDILSEINAKKVKAEKKRLQAIADAKKRSSSSRRRTTKTYNPFTRTYTTTAVNVYGDKAYASRLAKAKASKKKLLRSETVYL